MRERGFNHWRIEWRVGGARGDSSSNKDVGRCRLLTRMAGAIAAKEDGRHRLQLTWGCVYTQWRLRAYRNSVAARNVRVLVEM